MGGAEIGGDATTGGDGATTDFETAAGAVRLGECVAVCATQMTLVPRISTAKIPSDIT